MGLVLSAPVQGLGHLSHGSGAHVRVVGKHDFEQHLEFAREVQFFYLGKKIRGFEVRGEKLYEDFALGPDIAPEIKGSSVNDIGVNRQHSFQHRARAGQFWVEKAKKLIVDFDLKVPVFIDDHHDIA